MSTSDKFYRLEILEQAAQCRPENYRRPDQPIKGFKCRVCGVECPIAPQLPERPVCEGHCPDHRYESMGSEGKWCVHCFAEEPWAMRTPDKQRKAAERERRQRQGLVRVEVYVLPADRAKVRKYAERLNKRAAPQEQP